MSQNNKGVDFWDKMFAEGRDYTVFNQVLLDQLIAEKGISGNVLDIGCGTGDLFVKLAKRGMSVTGLDFSSVAIEKAKMRAQQAGIAPKFIIGSIDALTTSEKFNAIFCKLVYAFIPEKASFLKTVKDLLVDGGIFILITPIINDLNKSLETKPGICITPEDVELLNSAFPSVEKYHTNYEDEGRIVQIYMCRK